MNELLFGKRKLRIEKKSRIIPKGKPTIVLAKALKVLTAATPATVEKDECLQALKDIYHVTEHESRQARIELVYQANAKLVPLLLDFVGTICLPKSHAHSLSLVLLNNLSTESENKRFIAVDCGAVKMLSLLLCEEPSCHLLAICLVNLSFSEVALRREWIALNADLQWMEALTYAIRVGSMTRDEYHLVQPFLEETAMHRRKPTDYLAILQAERQSRNGNASLQQIHETLPSRGDQLFPETVRWCLSILKNISRPHAEIEISDLVFQSGIVPFLLQCITLCHVKSRTPLAPASAPLDGDDFAMTESRSSSMSTACVSLNSPDMWDASSSQDAALYVLLNLAADAKNHQRLIDMDALLLLSLITQFAESHERDEYFDAGAPSDRLRVLDLQSLKARMAMAFLLGSRGHFGQPSQKLELLETHEDDDDALLTLYEADVVLLLELLANTLHSRDKPGAGGYSAFAMSPKLVLRAVRCMLVDYKNQMLFSESTGSRLNALLLKAMALHVFGGRPLIDTEAAEDAAVSLYLQSNLGFKFPFLPSVYSNSDPSKGIAARVFAAFARNKDATLPGKYAARQMLLRVVHLQFGASERDICLSAGTFEMSDFLFPSILLKTTKVICLPPNIGGTKPRKDLFDRSLFQRSAPSGVWGQSSNISWFPNAIVTVQEIVLKSVKNRKEAPADVDDIAIANTIASCADGDMAEAYGFIWAWEDNAPRIKMFFEGTSFQPCSGPSAVRSQLLQQAVGTWTSCGKPGVSKV